VKGRGIPPLPMNSPHVHVECCSQVLYNSLFTSLGASELWGPQKVANFLGYETWAAIGTPRPSPPRKMGEVLSPHLLPWVKAKGYTKKWTMLQIRGASCQKGHRFFHSEGVSGYAKKVPLPFLVLRGVGSFSRCGISAIPMLGLSPKMES